MNKPRGAQPLADLVRPAIADAIKAQGFATADILSRWPDIAGARLAACSMPVRVLWPPRPKAAVPGARLPILRRREHPLCFICQQTAPFQRIHSSKALNHRSSRSWRSTMERRCARHNRSAGRGHVDDAQSPVALIHNLRD